MLLASGAARRGVSDSCGGISMREEFEKKNISVSHIVNMDEVLLTFDIPLGRCVAEKGEKTNCQGNRP